MDDDDDEGGGKPDPAFRACVKKALSSKKKCVSLSNAVHRCRDGSDGSDDINVIHLKAKAHAPAGIPPPAAHTAGKAPVTVNPPSAHHYPRVQPVPPIATPSQPGKPPGPGSLPNPNIAAQPVKHNQPAPPGVPKIHHKPPPALGAPPGPNTPALAKLGAPPANSNYPHPLAIPKIPPKHHPKVAAYNHHALAKPAANPGMPPHATKEFVAVKPKPLPHHEKKKIAKKQPPNTGNCGGHTDLYCVEHEMAGNKLTMGCGSRNRDYQQHKKPVFQSNCGGHTDPYCVQHDFAGNTMPLGCM